MYYALLIYEDEAAYGEERDSPLLQAMIARHEAFARDLGAARVGGAGLTGVASATTVRTTGGIKTVHDGPFAETKEQLGGFYLIEAPDLEAALAIARQVPLAANGAVEVRPLIEMPG
ncbi:YciI family protein [Nitrospirillum sp. BR 11752]|uniref:YciI family protein n=1 Tax=Nitrospirillum sp. BR 11752 TaxID=3104293 RepID=UPI002EC00619|nr:YciI family protein [Nitrospirillum sp. BR 11752]